MDESPNMRDVAGLKELFRAEIAVLVGEVRALGDDIREVKEAVKDTRTTCNGRRDELNQALGTLSSEQTAVKTQLRIVGAGVVIALTAALKGFFDWLTK